MKQLIFALLISFAFSSNVLAEEEKKQDAVMPAVIILIACKVKQAGPPDQNADFTHAENIEWEYENAMMHCKRMEIPVVDSAVEASTEAMPADPVPFTLEQCQRAGVMQATEWNKAHASSKYRIWRTSCPTPIISSLSGRIVDYQLPECGHREFVICEADTPI